MKWIRLEDKEPPINVDLWGYDVFYEGLGPAIWDGKSRTDDGLPSIELTEERGDDYYVKYWMIMERPSPPNVAEIEETSQ